MQQPTKQQVYDHLAVITKTIQVWRKRHAGGIRMNWFVTFSYGLLHSDMALLAGLQELTNCVRTKGVVWKTCRERWIIGMEGERESMKSVEGGQYDDADDFRQTFFFPVRVMRSVYRNTYQPITFKMAKPAGAVEYTDYNSTEG